MQASETDRQVMLKHLEVLNQKTSEVREDGNRFSARFLIGGIVAVIGLVNLDLVFEDRLGGVAAAGWLSGVFLISVLVLSGIYFHLVAGRIQYFRRQYRLAKHKYELTLYALLTHCPPATLMAALEQPARPAPEPLSFPRDGNFEAVAAYLHDHHGRRYADVERWRSWSVAMVVVVLVILARLAVARLPAG